jgi:hypothetical protein
MTVAELIEQLKQYPSDMLVVTEGYEERFDSIKSVQEINIKEADKKEWYLGKYDTPWNSTEGCFKAVFLYAGNKEDNK